MNKMHYLTSTFNNLKEKIYKSNIKNELKMH